MFLYNYILYIYLFKNRILLLGKVKYVVSTYENLTFHLENQMGGHLVCVVGACIKKLASFILIYAHPCHSHSM